MIDQRVVICSSWSLLPGSGSEGVCIGGLAWKNRHGSKRGQAWLEKGSGTFVRSTLRAVPAKVPDPFSSQAPLCAAPCGPFRQRCLTPFRTMPEKRQAVASHACYQPGRGSVLICDRDRGIFREGGALTPAASS